MRKQVSRMSGSIISRVGAVGMRRVRLAQHLDCKSRSSWGKIYAWNPSVQGTKSEDTVIVTESENEIITGIPGWPSVAVDYQGKTYLRPAIKEILY